MNEIGDEGAAALVHAALSGAVPKLKSISLDQHVKHRPERWPAKPALGVPPGYRPVVP